MSAAKEDREIASEMRPKTLHLEITRKRGRSRTWARTSRMHKLYCELASRAWFATRACEANDFSSSLEIIHGDRQPFLATAHSVASAWNALQKVPQEKGGWSAI